MKMNKSHNQDQLEILTKITQFKKRILIYSVDNDFCQSLTLLFQSKYHVFSTIDINKIVEISEKENIDLVLVDSINSDERVFLHVKKLKNLLPEIKIVLLYVYKFSYIEMEKRYREIVDGLFYKPVDIYQVMGVMKDLLK